MKPAPNNLLTLAELSEATGIPPRTIRFYIARGLLAGAVKAGKHSAYDARHLKRLRRIQKLQAKGLTLSEIGRELVEGKTGAHLAPPVTWQSYTIDEDVVVNVRAGVSPWRMRQIRESLEELASRLAGKGGSTNHDENK